VIKTKRIPDSQELFIKGYEKRAFSSFLTERFEEYHISVSNRNVLRGLHYQIEPKAQGKSITVTFGRIPHGMVDNRDHSETFSKHTMNELSSIGIDST